MAPIDWDSRLATGDEELDAQHHTLIDTFNRISAVVAAGPHNREELEGLLIFLRDFALLHFELEQELMVASGYPEEARHRQLHAELGAQVDTVLEAFHAGRTALTPVILEYLDAWLQRHIREEDFRLAEFLQRAGSREKGHV